MERVTIQCGGDAFSFEDKYEYDALLEANDWLHSKAEKLCNFFKKDGEFMKSIVCSKDGIPSEIKYYDNLKGTDITPKLLRTGELFPFGVTREKSGKTVDKKYCYVVLEKFGKSLDKNYPITEGMIPSELLLEYPETFEKIFPSDVFPENLREKIMDLLQRLSAKGVEHLDVHTGNILMNEQGELRLIDFEHAAFL
ncbi:putative serine/threonine protein kinase [Port-miou virus]|uniref:Putative serine/threonine protein kinase n=1 Tax=Port-miou virus TaxID=1733873 RepID=A0A0N9PHZ1_9VIRU|nr:putative serine/threonine protein kinase [Port-miou virus]